MAPPFLAKLALFVAMSSFIAYAGDPNQLQDFCVTSIDPNNTLFVNGFMCKNPSLVTIDDFVYTGFNVPGNTSNIDGSAKKVLSPKELPGLNTLGISIARLDYEPGGGLVPLHFHPRTTEVLTLLEGSLYVGFVSSIATGYKLYSKVIYAGDVIVFPQGLIHFGYNIGKTKASGIAAFSSQDPSNIRLGNSVFASDPPIRADLVAKSFQLDEKIVKEIQSKTFVGLNRK